jgi:hypothetical protein
LCGFCKCSHIDEYAALSKTPHALADGLMLVFQHPAEDGGLGAVKKIPWPQRQTDPAANRRLPSTALDVSGFFL